MKVLVTGSTGFIGGRLCRELCIRGHSVRAFHRPSSSLRALDRLPVDHVLGDLTDPASIEAAMRGVEVVFHAGAQLGGPGDPGRHYAVTVEGTRALMQAAQSAGVNRVVHTSSVAALGVPDELPANGGPLPLMDENHTWNYRAGRWAYGYAKYLAELEVQKAVAAGLDVVIVNPSVVLGPGDVYRSARSPVVFAAQGRVPVTTEGGWNVVHVEDVIAGHLAALDCGRTGERYILGGQNMTISTFFKMAAELTGGAPPRTELPAWLARSLAGPVRLIAPFLNLPVTHETLYLAGCYFYYDTTKSHTALGLPEPRSPQAAIQDAWDWFKLSPKG